MIIDYDEVSRFLEYCPETGVLTWKDRDSKMFHNAGMVAGSEHYGSRNKTKYIRVQLNGKFYYAHRLAWLLHYKQWPKKQIDHINRDGTDNRICNLRDVSQSANALNRGVMSCNKTGVTGISYNEKRKEWLARITINKKVIFLGWFKCKSKAISARKDAELKYIGR